MRRARSLSQKSIPNGAVNPSSAGKGSRRDQAFGPSQVQLSLFGFAGDPGSGWLEDHAQVDLSTQQGRGQPCKEE
jgi:hypothetical protein